MKTKRSVSLLIGLCAVFAVVIVQSCKKEEKEPEPTPTPAPPAEFVADNTSFTVFSSWALQATNKGADPALGTAHGGNDSTVTRKVYFKDGQNAVNGKYPQGTIIVKHSTNPVNSVNELTAMVKRGGNFNTDKGGWEFFMLASDGKIATDANGAPMRGANLMNGMCAGCHSGAASKDYIFSK